jgi:hypothetical protein
VDVALEYRVRGVAGTLNTRRRMDLRNRDGAWRVVRVRGRERPPWEAGRFVRARSEHFVMLLPQGVP